MAETEEERKEREERERNDEESLRNQRQVAALSQAPPDHNFPSSQISSPPLSEGEALPDPQTEPDATEELVQTEQTTEDLTDPTGEDSQETEPTEDTEDTEETEIKQPLSDEIEADEENPEDKIETESQQDPEDDDSGNPIIDRASFLNAYDDIQQSQISTTDKVADVAYGVVYGIGKILEQDLRAYRDAYRFATGTESDYLRSDDYILISDRWQPSTALGRTVSSITTLTVGLGLMAFTPVGKAGLALRVTRLAAAPATHAAKLTMYLPRLVPGVGKVTADTTSAFAAAVRAKISGIPKVGKYITETVPRTLYYGFTISDPYQESLILTSLDVPYIKDFLDPTYTDPWNEEIDAYKNLKHRMAFAGEEILFSTAFDFVARLAFSKRFKGMNKKKANEAVSKAQKVDEEEVSKLVSAVETEASESAKLSAENIAKYSSNPEAKLVRDGFAENIWHEQLRRRSMDEGVPVEDFIRGYTKRERDDILLSIGENPSKKSADNLIESYGRVGDDLHAKTSAAPNPREISVDQLRKTVDKGLSRGLAKVSKSGGDGLTNVIDSQSDGFSRIVLETIKNNPDDPNIGSTIIGAITKIPGAKKLFTSDFTINENVINGAMREMSDITGENFEEILLKMDTVASAGLSIPRFALISRAIIANKLKHVHHLELLADASEGGMRNFQQATNELLLIVNSSLNLRASAGRALRGFGEMGVSDDLLEATRNIFGNVENMKRFRLMVRAANGDPSMMKGLAKIVNPGEDIANKSTRSAVEFYRSALLSGVKTQVIGVISGAMETVGNASINYAVAGMKSSLKIGGAEQRDAFIRAQGQWIGLTTYVMDSLRMAKASFNLERSVIDPGVSRIDTPRQAISARAWNIENEGTANLVDSVGKIARMPLRLLGTVDEFYRQINYRSSVFSRAYTEGIQKFPDDIASAKRFAEDQVSASISGTGKGLDEIGTLDAQRSVFVENTKNQLLKSVQEFTYKNPFMQFVIPFARVPSNILMRTAERTPFGYFSKRYQAALASKNTTELNNLQGWWAVSTGVLALGTALSQRGMITGAPPPDRKTRELWYDAGNQPYSMRLGDKVFKYNRLDPLFIPLGFISTLTNVWGETDDEENVSFSSAAISALATTLEDRAYMRGITMFLDAFTTYDPTFQGKSSAVKFIENTATGFLPAVFRDAAILARNNLGTKQELYRLSDFEDKIMYNLGKRKGLIKRINPFTGDSVVVSDIATLGFPIKTIDPKHAPTFKEILSFNKEFTIRSYRIGSVKLNDAQQEEFNAIVSSAKGPNHPKLITAIANAMNTKEYKTEFYSLRFATDSTQQKIIDRVIADYRQQAREEFKRKHPELFGNKRTRQGRSSLKNPTRGTQLRKIFSRGNQK